MSPLQKIKPFLKIFQTKLLLLNKKLSIDTFFQNKKADQIYSKIGAA